MSSFRDEVNAKVKEVHEIAVSKGWWFGGDRNPLEIAALIHSEVSEFVEEFRDGKPAWYQLVADKTPGAMLVVENGTDPTLKPEGQLVELADAVIRIMDYAGRMGWDLGGAIETKIEFNRGRLYRHGGKKA